MTPAVKLPAFGVNRISAIPVVISSGSIKLTLVFSAAAAAVAIVVVDPVTKAADQVSSPAPSVTAVSTFICTASNRAPLGMLIVVVSLVVASDSVCVSDDMPRVSLPVASGEWDTEELNVAAPVSIEASANTVKQLVLRLFE